MRGRALAYGAVTIVNAIASGRGAALGIKLKTIAEVELSRERGIQVEIMGAPEEDPRLAQESVKAVLKRVGVQGYGAHVSITSEIPIARGLKSSSVASNAVVLATLAALKEEIEDMEDINLGVDASLAAGVSITGAFDDASASYFGGAVVTDNRERRIIKREEVEEDLMVVLYIPSQKMYTKDVNKQRLMKLGGLVDEIHRLAVEGRYWKAMTLNGLLYAPALGFQPEIIIDALEEGAIAASLSGTGPSFAAVCPCDSVEAVSSCWAGLPGRVVTVEVNNEKAGVIG
ncbi:MAG: shikimate kinase [Candidatus Bathyarchaeia archaeon]